MRSPLAVLAVALAGVVGLTSTAEAKTYCQKATKGRKVLKRVDGVTVYSEGGSLISACSDAKRKNATLYSMDAGYKLAKVVSAKHRCLAIVVTSKTGLPEILFKDLAGKETGTAVNTIGYGAPSATVNSISMASNCAVAWGEAVSDGAGGTAFTIRARTINETYNSLPHGQAVQVATGTTADDVAHVKATAAGKLVKVNYTLSGTPQSTTVPAA
jgi:hypothetical protein